MFVAAYLMGVAVTSAYTAYLLKTNEVGWLELAPSSLSVGSLWPIWIPVFLVARSALSDP